MPIFVAQVIDSSGREITVEKSFFDEESARRKLLTGDVDVESGLTIKYQKLLSIQRVDDGYFNRKLEAAKETEIPVFGFPNEGARVLLTNGFQVAGRLIERDLGIVGAEVVHGIGLLNDMLIDVKNVFGGTSGTFQSFIQEARASLISSLRRTAEEMGADAVICLTIQHTPVDRMLMSVGTGTAVKLHSDLKD